MNKITKITSTNAIIQLSYNIGGAQKVYVPLTSIQKIEQFGEQCEVSLLSDKEHKYYFDGKVDQLISELNR